MYDFSERCAKGNQQVQLYWETRLTFVKYQASSSETLIAQEKSMKEELFLQNILFFLFENINVTGEINARTTWAQAILHYQVTTDGAFKPSTP